MARVRLSVTLQLATVAAGLVASAINLTLTDSAGVAHDVAPIDAAGLTDDGTGRAVVVVDVVDDIPVGDITGTAQAVDASGANVGDAASYSGTVPAAGGGTGGLQWVPVSVTPSFSS